MRNFTTIGDPTIVNIPIRDTGDPFADLREYGFLIDESRSQISSRSPNFTKVRKKIAEKLVRAEKSLPGNFRFLIKEAYRPVSQQLQSYNSVMNRYTQQYKNLTIEQIIIETNKLCAPVESAPHPAGAAVDLTLFDTVQNRELDMGTEYNADPLESEQATYLEAVNIGETASNYRIILKNAMEQEHFICYPSEWWHWSYGDKYWAYTMNEDYALYGPVKERDI